MASRTKAWRGELLFLSFAFFLLRFLFFFFALLKGDKANDGFDVGKMREISYELGSSFSRVLTLKVFLLFFSALLFFSFHHNQKMQTDFLCARDPFFCVIFVFYVFLCSFANFRIRTEMHVSRFPFSQRVGGREEGKSHVCECGCLRTVVSGTYRNGFYGFLLLLLFICKRMRANKKKMANSQKMTGSSFVSFRFIASCVLALAEKKVERGGGDGGI